MRTTVTLDDDTAALVQQRMREQGVSFEVALNDAIRAGMSARTHFHAEPGGRGARPEAAPRRVRAVDADVLLYAVNSAADRHREGRSISPRSPSSTAPRS